MANETVIDTDKNTAPKVRRTKNREKPIQKWRLITQAAFALLCIWIGVEFHFFVKYLESGGTSSFVERPPGVEGFLPISSLMSLYYFFLSGEIHPAHPAGLFILVAIIVMSFVFAKAFCSWLCPVGTISEYVADFGEKIFKRRISLPRFLDYPLRSLKYILLGFFAWAIFFAMTEPSLKTFLGSPYNVVADIKMYYFFAEISQFALIVIGALLLLSVVIRGFWCRYLCPYGALLGMIGILSPNRIRRDTVKCIDCAKCAQACPSRIKVDKVQTVISDECTSCMQCVDSCPIADTLEVRTQIGGRRVSKKLVGAVTVGIFLLVTGSAMILGYWQNDIPKEEYLHHQKYLDSYGHPTGSSDIEQLNKESSK